MITEDYQAQITEAVRQGMADYHERRGEKFLRKPLVLDRTGVGNSTLYSMIRDGTFPAPIKMQGTTSRISLWLESEVSGWISDQVQAAKAGEI